MFPIPPANHSSFGGIYFLIHQWELSQVLACENMCQAIYQSLPHGTLHSASFSFVSINTPHTYYMAYREGKNSHISTIK